MVWVSKKEFDDYYQSPTWFNKRREALKYYGWRCQVCGARRRLQVNHIEYNDRWGGKEKMYDLMPLCRKHHVAVTEYVREHKGEADMYHLTWQWFWETKKKLSTSRAVAKH